MSSRSKKRDKKARGKGLFSRHTAYKGSVEQKREKLELELIALGMKKRLSEPDGCQVVDIRCENCGDMFEEEYGTACAHKCSEMPSLCIKCEGATADIRAPRVTVGGVLILWALGV